MNVRYEGRSDLRFNVDRDVIPQLLCLCCYKQCWVKEHSVDPRIYSVLMKRDICSSFEIDCVIILPISPLSPNASAGLLSPRTKELFLLCCMLFHYASY